MLGTKIQTLRKNKGYSQEVLAEKLNVVRQTVSKWEKELSVPDATMLKNIAEIFDVPISDLLDGKVPEQDVKGGLEAISQQLAVLNEQYAERNNVRKRNIKCFGCILFCLLILGILVAILPGWTKIWNEVGRNLFHMVNG